MHVYIYTTNVYTYKATTTTELLSAGLNIE